MGRTDRCPNSGRGLLLCLSLASALLLLAITLILSSAAVIFSGANGMGRQCIKLSKPSPSPLPSPSPPLPASNSSSGERFAIVTCSDGGTRIPGRSFDGLLDLVEPNKRGYVLRHGYAYIDASSSLDPSRPPSWSKILAVRKHLPNFDWVFWNDVDSLVTNPDISLDDIVRSVVENEGVKSGARPLPDFIVTRDVTGINAGMFFFRNSDWSFEFLERWWNQTSFIRPFGQRKSGDNDALKHLIRSMPQNELQQHVRIAEMQCAFNSYLWRPSLKNGRRLVVLPRTVWQGVYSHGDFMVHLAGVNDKKTWIQRILWDLEGRRPAGRGSFLIGDGPA